MGSWSWRIGGGAKECEQTRLCPSALHAFLVSCVMMLRFSVSSFHFSSDLIFSFPVDKSRPLKQLRHFAFVDSVVSFSPSIPVADIIQFMPLPILGLPGILCFFTYLFGFRRPWTS